MNISYLDLGLYRDPGASNDRIDQLFEIAPYLEALDFNRIWLGEHHGHDCAWRSPEILMSLLLAATEKIKVGSAGNLLRLHNALRLVQDYSLMEGLFPNRVDMGLSPGDVPLKIRKALLKGIDERSLTDGNYFNSFSRKAEDIFGFFNASFEKNKGIYDIPTPPYVKKLKPNIWFLSSSNSKVDLAIKNKANYVWSLFHSKEKYWPEDNCVLDFENSYYKTNQKLPETALAISIICLADQKRVSFLKNQFKDSFYITISGSKEQCASQIHDLLIRFKGVKEIVISDLTLTIEEKKESCANFKEIINELDF